MSRGQLVLLLLLAALLAGAILLRGGAGPPAERSRPVPVGATAAPLRVTDLEGNALRIGDYQDHAATVVWWWSAVCRCVYDCEERIRALRERYRDRDVRFVAVDANDFDTPTAIRELLRRMGSTYTVHRDLGARDAIRYGIEASASVLVIDRRGTVRYRGAIDDDLAKPTVSYIHRALDAILEGKSFTPTETESYGCVYPLPDP